jgi:arylsulfatase A-like enzyme
VLRRPSLRVYGFAFGIVFGLGALSAAPSAARYPHVVLITVDTLRADRLSSYGYGRATTPNVDRLLAAGVRYEQAYTVEPLTNPALVSLLTSLHPHEHGATRNGLQMRPDLPSLPALLGRGAFHTAAFVGNWTLRDRLSGLSAHFDDYHEIFSRKRWLVLKSEATADDLTAAALDWLEQTREKRPRRPLLLWVHYVDPHAPYRLQEPFVSRLGYRKGVDLTAQQRYDTEVAFVDAAIGNLLAGVRRLVGSDELLVAFAADHGESFGTFGYWGHGRHLYEDGLRVPMGIVWEGKIAPRVVRETASLLDLGPTLLGLIGYPAIRNARGFDWTPVLRGQAEPPRRAAYFQAHKGAVQSVEDLTRARRRGLLEIAILQDGRKETLRLRSGERLVVDVGKGVRDGRNLVDARSPPSPELLRWRELVERGLVAADRLPVAAVDAETDAAMRALGYID